MMEQLMAALQQQQQPEPPQRRTEGNMQMADELEVADSPLYQNSQFEKAPLGDLVNAIFAGGMNPMQQQQQPPMGGQMPMGQPPMGGQPPQGMPQMAPPQQAGHPMMGMPPPQMGMG